ncbi:MAG: hypothetical protein R6V60_19440 [Desulfobacterales bacterium]
MAVVPLIAAFHPMAARIAQGPNNRVAPGDYRRPPAVAALGKGFIWTVTT